MKQKQKLPIFLLFLCCFAFSLSSIADNKVDSLKNLLNFNEDKEQLEILKQLSDIQMERQPSKTLEYSKRALIISQKLKNKKDEYELLISIGKIYNKIELYEDALEYFLFAFNLAKENKGNGEIASAYNNLGIVYANLNNTKEALSYFEKYLRIQEENLDKDQMIVAYNNIASVYYTKKDYKTAINFYEKSVKIEKEILDTVNLVLTLNNLGLIYLDMNDYNNSKKFFSEGLTLAKENNFIDDIIYSNSNLVDLHLKKAEYQLARKYLEENITLAKQQGSIIVLRNTYKNYSLLHEKLQNYKQAYIYFKLYTQYKDSILSIDNNKKIVDLKIIYSSGSEKNENKKLKKDINKLKISKQNSFLSLHVVFGFLIVLLLIMLLIMIKINKKKKTGLKKKYMEIKQINSEINSQKLMNEQRVEQKTHQLQNDIEKRKGTEEELKIALNQTEKTNKEKYAFLINMSHEIRNPLNAIIGLSNLVENSLKDTNVDCSRYIDGIKKSSNTLLNYFNNMLEHSLIEDVDSDIIQCNVCEIIETSIQMHSFTANEKGLELNLTKNILPKVNVDCKIIAKVFSKVIENAVKYTKEGGIDISSMHMPESNEVYIQVSDTGIGIDQELLPHIFESVALESEGYYKSFDGTEKGLSLSKKLIELIGGRIEISSKKNKGTIVKIFIPVEEIDESLSDKQYIISADEMHISNDILKESGLEILIIEDDEFNALILEEILTKIGKTTTAVDGNNALEIIQNKSGETKKFDIIISDINLPGKLDGIELMKTIKEKWNFYKDVPFIAQTAYAMSKDRERLLKSGFDDYISKPIDNDELLVIIKSKLI